MAYATCDVQMLRGKDGEYVLKEFAVFEPTDVSYVHKAVTFSPPYDGAAIREKYLRQNRYIVSHLHGLQWEQGTSPYERAPQTLDEMTRDYTHLYVKGDDKQKILQYLLPSKTVFNVELFGCPKLKKLPLVWAPCPHDMQGTHSYLNCAVRNAKRVGLWLQAYLKTL